MKKKLLLTALTSLIAAAVFAADAPPVGSAAPDFSLPDANGQTHSLSQYKGKYDVLEWFKAQGSGYQTRINAVLRAFKDASP